MTNSNQIINIIADKKVLFISTKNADYIRNSQEISLLNEHSQKLDLIVSNNKSYLKRIIYVYVKTIQYLIRNNFDILFIGFAPQLLFFLFPFFPKNKPIVMDFFISFFDTLVDDRKKFSNGSFFAKLFFYLDRKTIHKADLIIADTKAHKKYFSDEFAYPPNNICVLYIVADTTIYQPFEDNSSKDKFEVIYFGSILPVQGLEVILEAMKILKNDDFIHFTIVGPVIKKYAIDQSEYPNTTFIEWLNQKDLAKEINHSHLALAGHFSKTIGKANRTIAGKTYIYKAMNKPVILGDSDANHELFTEDDMHLFVPRGDATALAKKILEQAVKKKKSR